MGFPKKSQDFRGSNRIRDSKAHILAHILAQMDDAGRSAKHREINQKETARERWSSDGHAEIIIWNSW